MPTLALHHVSIPCRDLARSAAFYEEVFGFDRLERPSFHIAGVWLGCGTQQIHLIDNAQGSFRDTPDISIADTHFAFRTDDFDGALASLTARGFSATAPEGDPRRLLVLRDGPAGFAQLYLLDPDLHIVEINAAP
ncbi:VOC family protein [Defluviimonas sp. WL0024]|uniref:VOC family protein n=2 Tax=Albidovulum TaxID=205889 RepID=A0ABT3J299_9RHOB|nr:MULTISPECIES: VOC family protein [Defluviimonas]MCU9847754.1 VOC family protein [Defluviimonas sp. WL0024]MCW3781817.1 VOC family protein [Defluviimonas salinarum]